MTGKETDKKVCKINDERIAGYTNRTRSGNEQIFYTGNDCRDWDRYRSEGGGSKPNVEMHDKPDTIRITPKSQSHYAKLIDGEWWWMEGCDQCNGRPRDGFTYMGECFDHDVCRTCGKHRNEFGPVWGGKEGWQCEPCHKAQHEAEKQEALDAMPDEFDEWDYHGLDEIKCPHCDYEFSDSFEYANLDENDMDCPRCDNTFEVTAVHTLTFNCERKS